VYTGNPKGEPAGFHQKTFRPSHGFMVPLGDIPLLSTRLAQLTSNPDLAARMGRESLKRITPWNFEADYSGLLGALDQTTRW